MTYAIVSCKKCRRQRIIDRSSASSKCPYCGTGAEHKGLTVVFENRDQNVVREALTRLHSLDLPEKKNTKRVDSDPFSTLIHRYENCADPQKKMELVSKGLTDLYGGFTLEDIERIDEKNASKLLSTMLEQCYAHEVKHGRYRA
ncbi:MAG: hypothetical protein LBB30_04975 [Candidatus Methanoplasma sp.]|jgi:ABC-type transporter Mla MlaB component|nr:hypothetical protein [Candidatus Methanoplasma sp.]